jgi:hypothetical protein
MATAFDKADRKGEAVDDPEGMRFIVISDTLASQISARLRESAGVIERKLSSTPGLNDSPLILCGKEEPDDGSHVS